jgi:hypothetical protein
MAKAAFILLRILTAVASLAACAGTIVVIVFTGLITLAKDGGHIFVTLARFFLSGLRDPGPTPPNPSPIPLPLVALSILFLAMFSSVFTASQKIFLHIVAAMAIVAAAWRISSMVANHDSQLLYLPVIALWFLFYFVCLRRPAHAG